MELLRKFLGSPQAEEDHANNPNEIPLEEAKRWQAALLEKTPYQDTYGLVLQRKDDSIYASLRVNPDRVFIDIPLIDTTPPMALVQGAYDTTFFGEIDLDRFRAFATRLDVRDSLLAALNQASSGGPSENIPEWFYGTFEVGHLQRYGPIFIGSHGGLGHKGYDFNATIESTDLKGNRGIAGKAEVSAAQFAQLTKEALPHIRIDPVPVEDFLQGVQDTLRFLPRDWDVSE